MKQNILNGSKSYFDSNVVITPDTIFDEFYKDRGDKGMRYGYKALGQFDKVQDKSSFLAKTKEFIESTQEDRIKSWGMSILERIGGVEAFDFIIDLLKRPKIREDKRKYVYTRFFALKAITHISETSPEKEPELIEILKIVSGDEDEDIFAQAGANMILLTRKQLDRKVRDSAKLKIKNWLNDNSFWPRMRVLRGLWEFPLAEFIDEVININSSIYINHQKYMIRALGAYAKISNIDEVYLKIINALGFIVRYSDDDSLRLNAIYSLSNFHYSDSQDYLVYALQDENAEVRLQAAKVLKLIMNNEAVSIIIQKSLKDGNSEASLINLIDALRVIDPERSISTRLLGNELTNTDQRRARTAEKILLDLGGWSALQTLNQRRKSLETLDKLLEKSEEAVKDTFQDTITQARRNFYFAMGVNIIIVATGIVLISIAISQLMNNPDNFQNWIIPGSGGVFGILMTMYFNNPSKNAREDLATLMNVNIIFLGFLRRLNQIDATFKHVYIESVSFSTNDMDKTIKQIEEAVNEGLTVSQNYLKNNDGDSKNNNTIKSK